MMICNDLGREKSGKDDVTHFNTSKPADSPTLTLFHDSGLLQTDGM